jgi:hypothetical protein
MEGILVLGLTIAAFALLDVFALRFGTDSRVDSKDAHVPAAGLTV